MPLDPHNLLSKVHPDLVKVIEAAAQIPFAFQVIQGLRTEAQEQTAVCTGHSTTMHSRHLPNANGVACAVDVAAVVNGHITFAPGDEARVYGHLAVEIKAAAAQLHIPIEWGGDWHTFKDFGHFQLPWEQYP